MYTGGRVAPKAAVEERAKLAEAALARCEDASEIQRIRLELAKADQEAKEELAVVEEELEDVLYGVADDTAALQQAIERCRGRMLTLRSGSNCTRRSTGERTWTATWRCRAG